MLFTDNKELFTYLHKITDKYPEDEVRISTYGMYLGISKGKDWSNRYPSEARTFVDKMRRQEDRLFRLLVGIPTFVECKDGCKECTEKYEERLNRFNETVRVLDIYTRFTLEHHLKMYSVGNIVILGGINLSDSGYTDAAVVVDSEAAADLNNLFDNAFHLAQDDALASLL